jgi:hypothetical protein
MEAFKDILKGNNFFFRKALAIFNSLFFLN